MNPPNANQYINSMYGLDQSNTGARRGRTIGEKRTDPKPQNRENEDNGETSEEDDNDMMFWVQLLTLKNAEHV